MFVCSVYLEKMKQTFVNKRILIIINTFERKLNIQNCLLTNLKSKEYFRKVDLMNKIGLVSVYLHQHALGHIS